MLKYKKIYTPFIVALLYLTIARLSLYLAYSNTNASPVWPPSGLAVALIILYGFRIWPGIFIGALIANIVSFSENAAAGTSTIIFTSLTIAIGNTLEALAAHFLYKKLIGKGLFYEKYQYVFRFLGITILASLISATIGTTALIINGIAPASIFIVIWRTWLLGDISGMLIISPLLMTWLKNEEKIKSNFTKINSIELFINILLTVGLCYSIFINTNSISIVQNRIYLIIPLLLWTAFRFNQRILISILVIVSSFAVLGTINDLGPFVSESLNQSLIELGAFISVITISFIALGASLYEKNAVTNVLKENKDQLESRVNERTSELASINNKLSAVIEKKEETEKQLTKSKEDFIKASKIAHLGHWKWDVMQNIIEWSDELYELYEQDRSSFDCSYASYINLVHPDDRKLADGMVKIAFQKKAPFEFDHRLIRKNGSIRWLHSSGEVITNNKGVVVEMLGTAQEITASKEKEQLTTYIASIIDNSADAIISKSMANKITSWNKAAENIFGYSNKEILGIDASILLPKNRIHEEDGFIERLINGETIAHFETQRITKDKKLINISLTLSPIKDVLGNLIGISTIARDITQQKEKEDARFKLIVESAPNAMILVNQLGKIELINTQTENLFGYTRNELIGQTIEILLPDRFKSSHPGYRNDFFASPKARVMGAGRDLFALHKNGQEIPVEIGLNPIETPGQTMVLAAIIDITERKKVEDSTRAKKIAEESVKLKDQFMANMSHEIRTPMNAIVGFVELLETTQLNPEQKQYTHAVKTSGRNLLSIINDILDFSKIEAGKLEIEKTNMNIGVLLSSLQEIFRSQAKEKDIDFKFKFDQSKAYLVSGDPNRLTQILMNLLGNAFKFTEKGLIELTLNVLKEDKDSYEFEFRIKDTGMGIPTNKLEHIFERFTQVSSDTTRKFGGTGLGLSIVKNLVELHHGTIKVESIEGVGTEFVVTLTYPKLDDGVLEEMDVQKDKIDLDKIGKLDILLAEDNLLNQKLAMIVLKRFGFNIDIADNGEIALDKIKQHKYDLILMDMQMPVMDGYEATLRIRKDSNDIPIIAMTAHALSGEREKCLNMGMDEYISKPFKADDLLNKIIQVITDKK